MWLVFFLEHIFHMDFGTLGIFPRSILGLVGIVTAPLIHGSYSHLISNTIPLLILGGSLFFFFPAHAPRVFMFVYFFTNSLVWFFARPYYHIGASGLVYGLASFLVFYGLFNRNFKSVLISIITLLFYGGLAQNLLFFETQISWESHLMGAIVGFTTAFLFSKY